MKSNPKDKTRETCLGFWLCNDFVLLLPATRLHILNSNVGLDGQRIKNESTLLCFHSPFFRISSLPSSPLRKRLKRIAFRFLATRLKFHTYSSYEAEESCVCQGYKKKVLPILWVISFSVWRILWYSVKEIDFHVESKSKNCV